MLQLFWSVESQDDLLTLIEYVAARNLPARAPAISVRGTNKSGLVGRCIAEAAEKRASSRAPGYTRSSPACAGASGTMRR
jgi:hypothetical protein